MKLYLALAPHARGDFLFPDGITVDLDVSACNPSCTSWECFLQTEVQGEFVSYLTNSGYTWHDEINGLPAKPGQKTWYMSYRVNDKHEDLRIIIDLDIFDEYDSECCYRVEMPYTKVQNEQLRS